MGLFDSLFGGGGLVSSQMPNSVGDPGALSDSAIQQLAMQNAASNPATMAIPNQNGPYSTMNSSPFANPEQVSAALASSSSGLSGLGSLGGLGGAPGAIPASSAQASPSSAPQQGGRGSGNIQVPDPLVAGQVPIIPGTGQQSAYLGPQPPLGAATQDPILINLIKQRLGMAG